MKHLLKEILNPTQACREMAEDSIRPEFQLVLSILGELMPAPEMDNVKN